MRSRKIQAALLVGCCLWSASNSYAASPDAVMLRKGELAPFDGQLLTDDVAISLGLKLERCNAELKLQEKYHEKREGVLRQYGDKGWSAASKAPQGWLLAVGGAGFVFGVGATIAIVWASREAR